MNNKGKLLFLPKLWLKLWYWYSQYVIYKKNLKPAKSEERLYCLGCSLKLLCDSRFQRAFTACSCVAFSKKLPLFEPTNVITLKMQLHAVNACVKRSSQRSFSDSIGEYRVPGYSTIMSLFLVLEFSSIWTEYRVFVFITILLLCIVLIKQIFN